MPKQTFKITDLSIGGKDIYFHTPIVLEYKPMGKYLIGHCERLDFTCLGDDEEDLMKEFKNEVRDLWDLYVEEEDHRMTSSALRLKYTLIAMTKLI